jgi:hypothetical protein
MNPRPYQPIRSTLEIIAGALGFLAFMAAICTPFFVMAAMQEPAHQVRFAEAGQ